MNKQYAIAWLVVFIVWMVGDVVVHGMLLHADYQALPNLFRPEAEAGKYLPLMIFAHVLLSGAFTWIYARGAEARPWLGQGLRFGVAIALLTIVPTSLIYYVVQPMPVALMVKQVVFAGILTLVLGAVAAFMYRNRAAG